MLDSSKVPKSIGGEKWIQTQYLDPSTLGSGMIAQGLLNLGLS
jgi:hypothetical protein